MTLQRLDEENFLATVTTDQITMVCFTSTAHPQCKGFDEIFETAANNHQDMVFATVDLSANRSLAREFAISAIPTITLFRQGIVLFSHKGALSFAEIESIIDSAKDIDIDEVRTEIRKLGE